MGDLLKTGCDWLAAMRKTHAASPVTYQRGVACVEVAATLGQTDFTVDDGSGIAQEYRSRDYLVLAADLVLAGQAIQPQRGDRITDGGKVYEVMAPGAEPPWRYSDPYGTTLRIHTKLVGTE